MIQQTEKKQPTRTKHCLNGKSKTQKFTTVDSHHPIFQVTDDSKISDVWKRQMFNDCMNIDNEPIDNTTEKYIELLEITALDLQKIPILTTVHQGEEEETERCYIHNNVENVVANRDQRSESLFKEYESNEGKEKDEKLEAGNIQSSPPQVETRLDANVMNSSQAIHLINDNKVHIIKTFNLSKDLVNTISSSPTYHKEMKQISIGTQTSKKSHHKYIQTTPISSLYKSKCTDDSSRMELGINRNQKRKKESLISYQKTLENVMELDKKSMTMKNSFYGNHGDIIPTFRNILRFWRDECYNLILSKNEMREILFSTRRKIKSIVGEKLQQDIKLKMILKRRENENACIIAKYREKETIANKKINQMKIELKTLKRDNASYELNIAKNLEMRSDQSMFSRIDSELKCGKLKLNMPLTTNNILASNIASFRKENNLMRLKLDKMTEENTVLNQVIEGVIKRAKDILHWQMCSCPEGSRSFFECVPKIASVYRKCGKKNAPTDFTSQDLKRNTESMFENILNKLRDLQHKIYRVSSTLRLISVWFDCRKIQIAKAVASFNTKKKSWIKIDKEYESPRQFIPEAKNSSISVTKNAADINKKDVNDTIYSNFIPRTSHLSIAKNESIPVEAESILRVVFKQAVELQHRDFGEKADAFRLERLLGSDNKIISLINMWTGDTYRWRKISKRLKKSSSVGKRKSDEEIIFSSLEETDKFDKPILITWGNFLRCISPPTLEKTKCQRNIFASFATKLSCILHDEEYWDLTATRPVNCVFELYVPSHPDDKSESHLYLTLMDVATLQKIVTRLIHEREWLMNIHWHVMKQEPRMYAIEAAHHFFSNFVVNTTERFVKLQNEMKIASKEKTSLQRQVGFYEKKTHKLSYKISKMKIKEGMLNQRMEKIMIKNDNISKLKAEYASAKSVAAQKELTIKRISNELEGMKTKFEKEKKKVEKLLIENEKLKQIENEDNHIISRYKIQMKELENEKQRLNDHCERLMNRLGEFDAIDRVLFNEKDRLSRSTNSSFPSLITDREQCKIKLVDNNSTSQHLSILEALAKSLLKDFNQECGLQV